MLAALLSAAACGGDSEAEKPSSASGGVAEDSLPVAMSVEEIRAEIESRRGKPLLVNYWAMWCSPCVAEMPDFLSAGADFEKRGGQILLVAMDQLALGPDPVELPGKLKGFLSKRGWDAECLLWDGEAKAKELVEVLGPITALPATISYSKSGAVVEAHEGAGTLEMFREMAQRAAEAQ